jgi:CheY-like chemotaxis protein
MFLTGKNIFIVDDSNISSTIMKVLLEAAGATVFIDRWATETVERMKAAGQIDLVIMDLMLPYGVTGYEVFDQLRADPDLKPVPVMIVSAADSSREMPIARQKGFVGYITKPINNYTFARNIGSVIEGKPFWDEDLFFSGR